MSGREHLFDDVAIEASCIQHITTSKREFYVDVHTEICTEETYNISKIMSKSCGRSCKKNRSGAAALQGRRTTLVFVSLVFVFIVVVVVIGLC